MNRQKRVLKRNAKYIPKETQRSKMTKKRAMCKQFSINVERMDVDKWLKNHADNSLEKEMENIFGDVTNTAEESVASSRRKESTKSDNRLGKHENGMVLLPRTFYNKHPAKSMVTTRRGAVRNTEKNETIVARGKGFAKTYPAKTNGLKRTDINKNKEQLNKNDVKDIKEPEISLKKLSPLIKPEILPSKLWEIDRIPPIKAQVADDTEEKLNGKSRNVLKECEEKKVDVVIETREEKRTSDKDIGEFCSVDTTKEELKPDESATLIVTETAQEDFPSIMEILNEKPVCETEDKLNSDIVMDDVETKVGNITAKESIAETPKSEENIIESVQNPDYILKTVIFKRYTEDKESFDRLVTFQFNLEYSVVINDETIELLGAPGIITDIEDIKILLQIVNDISLDSCSIACKS